MHERQKWFTDRRNVTEGDIVLLYDALAPRCHWSLWRVVEAYQSDDGLVRKVKVRAGGKEYLRPISKLVMMLESETEGG